MGAAKFAPDVDVYTAQAWMTDDDVSVVDRWKAAWHKNGAAVTGGITAPTLRVIKDTDGTDLIPTTPMIPVGGTGFLQVIEGANRVANGASYSVVLEATIDGAVRTVYSSMSRDSVV
jgi:hypothetical protein